jgi:hypothetical protein
MRDVDEPSDPRPPVDADLVRAELADQVVEVLDDAPQLASGSSRHLLLRRLERQLGRVLGIADYPVKRQWFNALVDALAGEPNGLPVLVRSVSRLGVGTRYLDELETLADQWRTADSMVGGRGITADGDLTTGGNGSDVEAVDLARPAPSDPARRPGPDLREPLSSHEVRELALVVNDPGQAGQMLAETGMTRDRIPPWNSDALTFWTTINALFAAGVVAQGRTRLLAAAAARYPANPVFGGSAL